MKLFHSPASPFVRKVMVLAIEAGIADQLQCVRAAVSPVSRNKDVSIHNPSGHIPTLLLDDGTAIYDSGVICQHLDMLHDGTPFVPAEPGQRIRALGLQALGDGILTAGVLMRYESGLRPKELFWPEWYDGQREKIRGSLKLLEENWIPYLNGPVNVGIITIACALGYLDFRFPDEDWRKEYPQLAAWYETFSQRDSMQATQHSAVV